MAVTPVVHDFLAQVLINPGTYNSPAFAWDPQFSEFVLQINPRPQDWVVGVAISYITYVSNDGGQTWNILGKGDTKDGALDHNGQFPAIRGFPPADTTHVKADMATNTRMHLGIQGTFS